MNYKKVPVLFHLLFVLISSSSVLASQHCPSALDFNGWNNIPMSSGDWLRLNDNLYKDWDTDYNNTKPFANFSYWNPPPPKLKFHMPDNTRLSVYIFADKNSQASCVYEGEAKNWIIGLGAKNSIEDPKKAVNLSAFKREPIYKEGAFNVELQPDKEDRSVIYIGDDYICHTTASTPELCSWD